MTGSFFVQGEVFHHQENDDYVFSLGSRKWAAVGLPLKRVTVDNQACVEETWGFIIDSVRCRDPLSEDYLLQAKDMEKEDMASAHIRWMCCFDLQGPWKLLPTERTLRAFMPAELLRLGQSSALRVAGPGEDIAKAAIKRGCFLTMPDLKQLCAALGVELPAKGSGKNNSVLKMDIASRLVEEMFPDATAEEKKDMVKKLVYRQTKKFTDQEEEILRCCGQLAEEDRECGEFKRVAQLARKTLKEKERRKAHQEGAKEGAKQHAAEAAAASAAEAAAKAASEPRAAPPPPRAEPAGPAGPRRPPKATPIGLRDLLCTETMKSEVTLLRDPTLFGYRATYPSFLS